MATIERISQRDDGRIGVWLDEKTEVELNDMDHVRAWCTSRPESFDDATAKQMLSSVAEGAKAAADIVTSKRIDFDAKVAIDAAVSVAVAVDAEVLVDKVEG